MKDAFAQSGLECCSATATDCGFKCYITSACPDCTCYGGGDSAGCWCLDPPEFYGVYCDDGDPDGPDPPGGGSGGCLPNDPYCVPKFPELD